MVIRKRMLVGVLAAAALGLAAVAIAATTVVVSADKTKLAYAKKALVANRGAVTLKMPNPSVIEHNIAIRKGVAKTGTKIKAGKIVGKGGVSKLTATLAAGKYRYFCSVKGHEAGGMWGILTVR